MKNPENAKIDEIKETPRKTLLKRWSQIVAKGQASTFMIMTRRTHAIQVSRGNKRAIQLENAEAFS